ncbi:VOC family protein [Adhaeribacter pallidiroseus]|uniref:Prolyl oligopeptidase n=1 Tax=Adhaeribacter pallidiroseus TaxID=2072847 RepID=A0A369QNA2_9BACT|nr:VOC family protein [Adhaeribacter pallidiroseus]RDC65812.1 Prolyl oligopeptidase [Adhaeribacter pallidiroseus]
MISFAQVRIARPTNQLTKVIPFYTEGLGLPQLSSFTDHAGYSGVMVGLPGREYHLEFTQHEAGSPGAAPTKDNLLVLYIPDPTEFSKAVVRLQNLGYFPVSPENPYWQDKSFTFEDPDGWRVVLFRGTWGEVE